MSARLTEIRVMVTGGAGFLGSEVVDELRLRGVTDIVIPRSNRHDLTDAARRARSFAATRPDLVLHLAAKVGGIGANRRLPGTFFRDNMAMGLNVLEEARRAGTPKVVVAGTICATPSSPPSRSAKTTSGTATPRRPTPLTASPRRPSWSWPRPTGRSSARTSSSSSRSTSTARATTSISKTRT